MNLKEFIQNEIKSTLLEDVELDQMFNKAEPVSESTIEWKDAEEGDSALVVKDNKMGLIIRAYGRKFHLKFVDGTMKTYDAKELKFYKFESVNEGPGWSKSALAAFNRKPMPGRYFISDENGNILEKGLKTSRSWVTYLQRFGKASYGYLGGQKPTVVNIHDGKKNNEVVDQYYWRDKSGKGNYSIDIDDPTLGSFDKIDPKYVNYKEIEKQLGIKKESVSEGMVSPSRGHNYYELTKDTPIKYISGHSGLGLEVPGVLLHNEYSTFKGKKGAYIIDYFGAYFYVDLKNKFASKIANPRSSEQTKGLMKNVKVIDKAPQHSDWKKFMKESVNEEQIDEKLITFSNRAPYGQIVFMAGGAGSGKGFAIGNFIDSAGFKVRDVDEMKNAVAKLDQLGKFSVDDWMKKYGDKLPEDQKAHVEEFVVGRGLNIEDVAADLKNPNNVASLHYIVDAMGLKDKWLINMLKGKENKETLPNLLFDITAKKVKSITSVIKPLVDAGYDANNIHLIWVLTNYHLAVAQNKSRSRVVPDDILLQTHEGAAKTIWSILTGGLPKGLNGRVDVILNNRENTVMFKDKDGNVLTGAVKGFKSLPIKKQGGGILPEKIWKKILYSWIDSNGPKTISLKKPLDRQINKK